LTFFLVLVKFLGSKGALFSLLFLLFLLFVFLCEFFLFFFQFLRFLVAILVLIGLLTLLFTFFVILASALIRIAGTAAVTRIALCLSSWISVFVGLRKNGKNVISVDAMSDLVYPFANTTDNLAFGH